MKKTKVVTQIETSDFRQVKTVRTDEDANKLLAEGWTLMSSGVCHVDNAGYQAKIYYILAK